MEIFVYYIIVAICCLVLFIFNNYLVKKNKLDYQWKITADLVPGINVIVFVIVIHNLTKKFYRTEREGLKCMKEYN